MEFEHPMRDNDFLQKVFASAPGVVAVVRASDLKIIFINELFEHYLGYTAEELKNSDVFFTQILDSYQHERLLHQITLVTHSIANRSAYVIYNLTDKKGKSSNYYLFISPVSGLSSEYDTYYYFYLQPDLSQWSMPFTSYGTRELFLQQFQSEDFGTFEWLSVSDQTYWSKGIYRIYEVDEQFKQINRAFAKMFIHPADTDWVTTKSTLAFQNSTLLDIEFRIITAKGNIKTIHSLAKTVLDSEGKMIKFVGSLRDVTSQRTIEKNLEKKVEELFQSNKELEEFAFVASHDMQEPLRKITTFGSRLHEKYHDQLIGDGSMYLSRIMASADNMRKLINDLLEFSRISKTAQAFEPVDLNLVFRQVKTDLELIIEETKSTIQCMPLPTVEAIATQMKQLLSNIISNAIKFHKPGVAPKIKIDFALATENEKQINDFSVNDTYYKFTIEDNGIGFEDIYASRIFNVFQRLHGKSEYPGSGIGLAICKKILDHHMGIIYAENIPQQGARFTFIMPRSRTDIL